MKSNSYVVIIVILSIIIIGEILVLVIPPKTNENKVNSNIRLVNTHVANGTILKGTKITSNYVKITEMPLSLTNLTDVYQSNLIVGKCAKETIAEGSLFYKDLVEDCKDESGEY